tara:strand:+ start:4098 stop:4670 length:573 start_codon:yes stop_codon:yes gene_type:complete
MNDKKELVAEISSGLFFLSKTMGSNQYDYGFAAQLYELDKNSLTTSYLKIIAKEKEAVNKEYSLDIDDNIDNEFFDNQVTIKSKKGMGIGFIEKFINKIFDKKIGNYKYVSWKMTDDIHLLFDWNIPDEFYMYDYHRSYECSEDKEVCHQSGKSLFLPIEGNEFLILHFHAEGKNSDILAYTVESIEKQD